ncbi:hypothetical protein DYB31_013563, partial [Aphanomyces astaci]
MQDHWRTGEQVDRHKGRNGEEEQCKKLRVDPFGDVASRVVSFMERLNNIIDTTGWKSQLKTLNMLKTFIKVVASCITPFDVRDRVEEQMKTVQASTLVEFSKILAEQLERTYQAELVMKSRGGDRKRGRDWDEKGQRTGKTRVQLKNEQYQREAYYQNGNAPRPKGGYTKPSPVERGRDGQVWYLGARSKIVNDLPSELSMAPAKTTVARYALSANNRDTVRAELKAKRAVRAMIAEDGREQRWIRLNVVFEVPYCPDTGADQNVLPQRMLEELMTLQPDLMMVTLKEPMIGMACNNLPFQANAYVDLALQLQTVAGPVKILGKWRCYVVAEGEEFLASDDTLKAIGIDIDRQVATLQLEDDEDDLEEVGDALKEQSHRSTLRIKASKAKLPEAKDEVEAALQDLINEAIDNQFPIENVQGLWRVLTKHDIWRLKYDGSDPPARVKPLTPKDGCVPYRCKGRKHNLLEERFLNLFAKELCDAGVIKRNQQSAWC